MSIRLLTASAVALGLVALNPAAHAQDAATVQQAIVVRDAAMRSNIAMDYVTQLTTRFGARPAGSRSEQQAAAWAASHRGEVASALSEVTGVEIKAQTVAAERTDFGILPLNDEIIAHQQATADRFLKLGLIRRPVRVRDAVWTPPRA